VTIDVVHDLSPEAISRFVRTDLANLTEEPASPINTFEFHGCVAGIGSFIGRPPWELHTQGDELLHILSGESRLTVREGDSETTLDLRAGHLVIVPKGCWHSNDAPRGVTMLYLTPLEGNRHSVGEPG